MDLITENDPDGFATGKSLREMPHGPADSTSPLEALQPAAPDLRSVPQPIESDRQTDDRSDGRPPRRFNWRILLVAALMLSAATIAPFVWSYLQSFQSTDDAQIDGHIDPLSSRINGTVIAVHGEDDDRVREGELLVEIDPRDFEVAVSRAEASLELARAQVASAKQDYAVALAATRESEADNYRAQRDAQRYAYLLDRQVVPQQQYDQYEAIARVDAAKTDAAREASGSSLKTIAAREAEVEVAQAALDQAQLNLSYTRIYAPADG
ncbi:MAG TPA: biotin/lipoyl-binding protein, partial [Candidatus Binataceae bacterium]|nr:biotin/lipoyl-binding protein [Candidatus Binataceae bacterium]